MRRALSLSQVPLLVTLALGVALWLAPGRTELALHLYVLALAALALGWLVGVVRRAHPTAAASPFDLALREPRAARTTLPELARLEREVSLAGSTAFDLHYRLRPTLRRVAAHLLAARGVDLDADAEGATALLGAEGYELVRPDREPPQVRYAPGLPLPQLHALVTRLESR